MKVLRIFRGKNSKYQSIEKVFANLPKINSDQLVISDYVLPSNRANGFALMQNLISVFFKKFDIYHITGVVSYIALVLPRANTMITIHDNIFLQKNGHLKKKILKKIFLDWPVKHAALVTTISQKTKQEIITLTDCNPEKIIVIPNPVDRHIYFSEIVINDNIPRFLFIGSTDNKNLERVLEACKGLELHLKLIGHYSLSQKQIIINAGVPFSIVSDISDADIAREYANCYAVLFPSLYEGFGLPIIEAQKAGRPVITSNISPMVEVSGGAALLVNPYDVSSIRNAIIKLISDRGLVFSLIEDGLKNIKEYEPGIISEKYNSLYYKLFYNSKVQ